MQLIDKEKLIETLQQIPCWECDGQGTDECYSCIVYSCIIEKVVDAPVVDAVPVVRCKDCIFSKPNDGKLVEGAMYCSLKIDRADLSFFNVWNYDFCSDAVERKKDETTANEDA